MAEQVCAPVAYRQVVLTCPSVCGCTPVSIASCWASSARASGPASRPKSDACWAAARRLRRHGAHVATPGPVRCMGGMVGPAGSRPSGLRRDASPAVDTDATSARERDTGERRDAGAGTGQHLPDRGQATVTGQVGGDRGSSQAPRRSLVLARLGHIHLGHLRRLAKLRRSPPRPPQNASQLCAWVSMTQARNGKPVACTGSAHLRAR